MAELFLLGFSFASAAALVWAIIFLSRRFHIYKRADQERWRKEPMPYWGGVGIWIAFSLTLLLFKGLNEETTLLFLSGTAMFLVGLTDDIYQLKPSTKLILQIVVASLASYGGIHIISITNPVAAIPISVIWLVGIANAVNLLDNMDGLAGGIALIAAFFIFCLSCLMGQAEIGSLALIMVGVLLGFMIFNFPPARIFMGDSGSLFIGFILAGLAIQGTWHQATNLFLVFLTPVLILGVAIFDTFMVSFKRLLQGRSIAEGGKDHSSHRLVALGWTEKQALFMLYGIALGLGGLTLLGLVLKAHVMFLAILLVVAVLITFGLFLSQADEKIEQPKKNGKPLFRPPTILHKRRYIEIFLDGLLIITAYVAGFLIRYDGKLDTYSLSIIQESLPLVLPAKLLSFLVAGLYTGVWKYLDFSDANKIFRSVFLGTLSSVVVVLGVYRFEGYSRAIFLIDFLVLFFLIIGVRVLLRMFREALYGYPKDGKRILIIGAGEAGQWVLNEIRKDRTKNLYPVAIVDDDPWKQGRKLFGVYVAGSCEKIHEIVVQEEIEEAIMAMPSAPERRRMDIVIGCAKIGIPVYDFRGAKDWGTHFPKVLPKDSYDTHSDSSSDWPTQSDPDERH
jgi:UDP-GlcNAc:undecaprenyl-phosphate GlcNAc-1-phosphate transferase